MRRDGFLLGVVATGSQVLLLRELISTLQGDELFVGTALCGWLLWGALGAYVGGRRNSLASPSLLLCLAALILPSAVILGGLSPLVVTGTVGEPVAFSYAALLSFLAMLPSAFVCGWLYSLFVRRAGNDTDAQIRVYFSEGVGAFTACLFIAALTGSNVSTLSTAGVLCGLVMTPLPLSPNVPLSRRTLPVAGGLVLAVLAVMAGPQIDLFVESVKYRPYQVVASSDNPYGHETLLARGGAHVALTDNTIESVEADLQTAEDLLLPPLAYRPEAKRILLLGRSDLCIGPLLAGLKALSVTEVDPRPPLDGIVPSPGSSHPLFHYVQDDPIAYLQSQSPGVFDVIIYPMGESGSLRALRPMTTRALSDARRVLSSHGVLHVVTSYDTERYVSPGDGLLLSTIRRTLETVFPRVVVWPGSNTLFLAGDSSLPDLRPTVIAARLEQLSYSPQFLTLGYLADRLNAWYVNRVDSATGLACSVNSLEQPTLANLQIMHRSRSHTVDRWAGSLVMHTRVWKTALLLAVLALAAAAIAWHGRGSIWVALYVAAGFVSLVLELVSFYVYQSCVGTLYSHLSVLVGSFMLGLAVGARLASSRRTHRLAPAVLALLTVTAVVFLVTALHLPLGVTLLFHAVFQFVVAFCTGALFVAATRRYYEGGWQHPGLGYALELTGSSAAALLTMPLFLPAFGLHRLLAATAILSGLLLIWTLVAGRRLKAAGVVRPPR